MSTVHVVVPAGIDDPARPSGGNRYDSRICTGLAGAGWRVHELLAPGAWPRPDPAAQDALAASVAGVPDGELLLVDGLIASTAPTVLVPESRRVRLAVLVHMPLGDVEAPAEDERAVLAATRAVVTTSDWSRARLLQQYPLDPDRVTVARPGADRGALSRGSPGGGRLLCVGTVQPHKGQDVLVEALAGLRDQEWGCTIVGPLDRDPVFVGELQRRIAAAGLDDRVKLTGPCDTDRLREQYAAADLLVLPSRLEAYGMVVTEALAVGLPVVATRVGGVPEALGTTSLGEPGGLIPPGDPGALRNALASWLRDPGLRARVRRAARERREALEGWDATTRAVATALSRARAEPEHALPRGLR